MFDERSNHEVEDVAEESEYEDDEEDINIVNEVEAFAGEFFDDVNLEVLLNATGKYIFFALFKRLFLLSRLKHLQQDVGAGGLHAGEYAYRRIYGRVYTY